MKSPTYKHYLITVRDEMDISTFEKRRFKIEKMEPLKAHELTIGEAGCKVYGTYVTPATPKRPTNRKLSSCITDKELPATPKRPPISTTQSSETGNSQSKEREEMCQVHTPKGSVAVDAVHVVSILNRLSKLEYESEKQKEEMESRTDQLSDDLKELKDAFEAECDHYDSDIKYLRQQLSELQQAFVLKGLCKPAIENEQFVVKNDDGSIRSCKTNEPPHGLTVNTNIPELMTIEEAEKQIKQLEANTEELLSERQWCLSTQHAVAKNIEKVCDLHGWIEAQKSIKPPVKPDTAEFIKTQEKRLIEDLGTYYVSEQATYLKLIVTKYLGIDVSSIDITAGNKVVYNNREKGIRIEFV